MSLKFSNLSPCAYKKDTSFGANSIWQTWTEQLGSEPHEQNEVGGPNSTCSYPGTVISLEEKSPLSDKFQNLKGYMAAGYQDCIWRRQN